MLGIAYDALCQRLFVTGKLWPKLFQIEVPGKFPPIPRSTPLPLPPTLINSHHHSLVGNTSCPFNTTTTTATPTPTPSSKTNNSPHRYH